MTAVSGFGSWIDRQIREAQERGEFDNLPRAGKPIKGLDSRRDDDWWAKSLIRREQWRQARAERDERRRRELDRSYGW